MDDERAACEKRVGTTLCGKWTIDRLLGIGGMAAVYAATHKIGRREAIKILHPEVARSKDIRARFEREAQAVNRFQHPGVVAIRDIDKTDEGTPFLVMELLEGESLGDRLQRLGTLDPAEVLRFVDELLDVLDAAHAQRIIHRDIKLDNLFVEHGGRLKVLDFGIAWMYSDGKNTPLTRTGATLGTVSYMAPEQVRGITVDHRADLFAVGATMFRIIAKRRLHEARTESELLIKMATMPAPPLGTVAPETSQGLCMVVDRALAFDREQRYPDARTMQEDVRALRRGAAPPFASARLAAGELPSSGAPALSPRHAAAGAPGAEPRAAVPGDPAEPRRTNPDARTTADAAPARTPMVSQASLGGAAAMGTELSLGGGTSPWDGPTMAAPSAFDGTAGMPQGAPVSPAMHASGMHQSAPVAPGSLHASGMRQAPVAPGSLHASGMRQAPVAPGSLHASGMRQGAPGPMHASGMHQSAQAAANAASWSPHRAPSKSGSKLPVVLAIGGAVLTLGFAIGAWRIFSSSNATTEIPRIELMSDAGTLNLPNPDSTAEADPPPSSSAQDAAASATASSRPAPSANPTAKPTVKGAKTTKGGSAAPTTTITVDWPGPTRPKKK